MFEKNSPDNDFSFTLTMRQLSLAVAGLLVFSFFIFISGYFLGQKRAAQDFVYRADQDSLADQIYSSICVLYDPKEEDESDSEEAESSEVEAVGETIEVAEVKDESMQEIATEPTLVTKNYKAVLSGFPATHVADAKQLIARLTNKGYPCELIEKTSVHKGRPKIWYQVVTKPDTREHLEKSKSQLAKIGYIKEQSITIEECA